jgi:hypothetical protein
VTDGNRFSGWVTAVVGLADGIALIGTEDGPNVGLEEYGTVESRDVGTGVGWTVAGCKDGNADGLDDVGAVDGDKDGEDVGLADTGDKFSGWVTAAVGIAEGSALVGCEDGTRVGLDVVGAFVGAFVGWMQNDGGCCSKVPQHPQKSLGCASK